MTAVCGGWPRRNLSGDYLIGGSVELPQRANVGWRVPLSLCGVTLYAQASALDSSQALGRALTNGLTLTIGE